MRDRDDDGMTNKEAAALFAALPPNEPARILVAYEDHDAQEHTELRRVWDVTPGAQGPEPMVVVPGWCG